MTETITAVLSRLAAIMERAGVAAFVAGGYIRDRLAGRETADVDIAVQANSLDVARVVAEALGGTLVLLDEANLVARVIAPGPERPWQLDFTCVSGAIEGDLGRRDFTVDAMALPLDALVRDEWTALVDPFGGRADLAARVLRATDDAVFRNDPIRLLRGIRLCAEMGLEPEERTRSLIERDAALLGTAAGERVREELLRLLATPQAGRWLHKMAGNGLLFSIVPEMALCRGVDQPGAHYWDVLDHSLETVTAVEHLLGERDWPHANADLRRDVPWSEAAAAHFSGEVSHGSSHRTLLKLAGLLHDVAKPQTKSIDETGRVRFLGHPAEGAAIAAAIMERLRFSARESAVVTTMVMDHLRPAQMSGDGLPTRRAVFRLFRDTGEAGLDVLFLSLADLLATLGPDPDLAEWRQKAELVSFVLAEHSRQEERTVPAKLIDGTDIMSVFGLPPGKPVGRLLTAVNEAQATGEVTTREEALDFVCRSLKKGDQ